MPRYFFIPLLILAILLPALTGYGGGSKKKTEIAVRFHAQADANDGEVFSSPLTIGDPPRDIFISKIPVVSENDITSVYTFPASDGTLGAYFRLDSHGRFSLEAITVAKKGGILVGMVNGRPATTLFIDKIIKDGVIGIPSGLTITEIELMEKEFNKKKK